MEEYEAAYKSVSIKDKADPQNKIQRRYWKQQGNSRPSPLTFRKWCAEGRTGPFKFEELFKLTGEIIRDFMKNDKIFQMGKKFLVICDRQ